MSTTSTPSTLYYCKCSKCKVIVYISEANIGKQHKDMFTSLCDGILEKVIRPLPQYTSKRKRSK